MDGKPHVAVHVAPRKKCLTHGVQRYAEFILRTIYHRDTPLVIGPYGKPEIVQNGDPLYFNGADSGRWVICAFGDRPLGVDLQEVKKDPRIPAIAGRMFDPAGRDRVLGTPSRRRAMMFSEAWAKREAVMKWSGRGFNLPMKTIVIDGSQVKGPADCEGLSLLAIPDFDANVYAAWLCGAYKEKPQIDVIWD
jgi:4'-phosphopantetheinyl transferase